MSMWGGQIARILRVGVRPCRIVRRLLLTTIQEPSQSEQAFGDKSYEKYNREPRAMSQAPTIFGKPHRFVLLHIAMVEFGAWG